MSTLLIETIESGGLEQEYRLALETRYNIGSIIPYLYMHNAPAGVFTLEVLVNAVSVFSQTFTSASIKASLPTVNDYARIFYPVVPINPLQLERGLFSVKISGDAAYLASYSSSSFLAWIKQHEDLSNDLDYTPSTDLENPLALRLKVLNQGITI